MEIQEKYLYWISNSDLETAKILKSIEKISLRFMIVFTKI